MTTLIFIYLISIFLSYKAMQIAYSKNGCFDGLNTGLRDIILIFLPIINSLVFIEFFLTYLYKKKINFDKFFKIKK